MERKILISVVTMLGLVSCIRNTVPYPTIVPEVKSIEVTEAASIDINASKREISIVLNEDADITNVSIGNAVLEPEMTKSEPAMSGSFDLSAPQTFVLETYQFYNWTISATQTIDRYVQVAGQIGQCVIDEVNCRVIIYVSPKADLSNIKVLSYRFGPASTTTCEPDLTTISNFTTERTIKVTRFGKTADWHVFVEKSESVVNFSSVDAWTRVAWLYASGIAGSDCGFRYRKAGEADWTDVPKSEVQVDGGSFKACIEGLDPETGYECVAYCGSDQSEVRSFTTEGEMQLPNAGFEVYSKAESANYYSWFAEGSAFTSKWWDSGNAGSTMVGASASICTPDTQEKSEGKASARLNSRYVVIKFAAGNLFSGEFSGLVGTSGGIVDFGRPFTLRPRKLVFSMKYECGKIDYVNGYPDNDPVKIGDPDRCNVYIALGDWDYRKYGGTKDSPVRVNTTKKETFFDSNSENVIAYGTYVRSTSTEGWIEVEIPLEYRTTSRIPTHIIVSCAASMLGDYFTGSSSSTLWIDDMRLVY